MAMSWEDLERQYAAPGAAPAAGNGGDPWAALEQKYAPPSMSTGSTGKAAKPEPKEVGLIDRVRAAATGINRGFFTDLLGMPVDAAANVLDLGKAGIGYATSKVSGKAPPEWTAPFDRRDVPLTADWNAKMINKGANAAGFASPIDNPNGHDLISRVLHMGGRVAGASVSPARNMPIGPGQQAINTGMGAAGGLLAGATGEIAPEWAGLAGMLPQATTATGAAAFRHGVRGGEQGRKQMEQRIQDFKNAGVDEPSVGLASGNKLVMGLENLLSQTPGSVGLFQNARERMIAGMQGRTNQIRDAISPEYGPVSAGAAIQSDLKGSFKDRIGNTYGRLNDRVEQAVGPNTPIPVDESILRSGLLTRPIPGAEATSSNFINPRIAKMNRDLQADSGGRPAQTINSAILGPDGLPAFSTTIPATPPQGVPFSAVKDLRTKIGKEAASNAIMGTPEQADFKQFYGAMSQDMKNGVGLADIRNGKLPGAPGSATTALNRANDFYSKAMGRADDLNGLANRSTPEGAYGSVANSLVSGPTLYQKLRGAVTPETRQKVVATVVDELGMARPGQQNAAGDGWSAQTFLTNFNRIDGKARGELFKRLPGGETHGKNLDDIAKAAEMIGASSKIWANPSGTAPALTARGTVYALTAGAFFEPVLAASTAGGLAAGHAAGRLLLNPQFANWLAKAPQVPPAKAKAYAQRLVMNSKMTNDEQFQADVTDYLQLVQEAFKEPE